jgi:ribonuclease P protein component
VVKIARIDDDRTLVGFAVSRAVGRAVVRNAVKRRLRAIVAGLLPDLPPGRAILVRALPPAATTTYRVLERDVREAAERAMAKVAS